MNECIVNILIYIVEVVLICFTNNSQVGEGVRVVNNGQVIESYCVK